MGILQILRVIDHDEAIVAVAIAIRAANGAHIASILIRLGGSSTKLKKIQNLNKEHLEIFKDHSLTSLWSLLLGWLLLPLCLAGLPRPYAESRRFRPM